MSLNGNRDNALSSRRLQKHQAQGEQFYNPSVFRYKCVGYLHLSSQDKGSHGTCRGLKSGMERVANMVPDTREGAIKKFLDASADLGTYVDTGTDDTSSDQKVKEIYTARTMIYKEDQDRSPKPSRIQPVKPSTSLPEEELINKTEWSCWGSTSVHFLVLEPISKTRSLAHDKAGSTAGKDDEQEQKKKAIARKREMQDLAKKERSLIQKKPEYAKVSAITPENIGISIRKIDSSFGYFTITDIGSIRICVESPAPLIRDNTTSSNSSKNLHEMGHNNNKNGQDSSTTTTTTDALQVNQTTVMDELKKFYKFTGKVGAQMKYNVHEVREALRDDFPGRTYRFGTKVVDRFQKTSEQTFSYMGKIFNRWWK